MFVMLSASFVVAVPVSSPKEGAAAAYWFNNAYAERSSPEEDAAGAERFGKAYVEASKEVTAKVGLLSITFYWNWLLTGALELSLLVHLL